MLEWTFHNKLERLSLLGKAEAYPSGAPTGLDFTGRLIALPVDIRPGACTITLFMAVIYGFS